MRSRHICSIFSVLACVFILTLLIPSSLPASDLLRFLPIEESKFVLRGEGWQQEEVVSATVYYDSTCLAAPEATAMGGELLELSRIGAVPGQLQLVIHNDRQSPGFEICLFFEKQDNCPAVIHFVTAEQDDPSGGRKPLQVEMLENPNLSQTEKIQRGDL